MSGIAAWAAARAAQLPHGTRARYVGARCRCADCRRANREYVARRTAEKKAAALAQPAPAMPGGVLQSWTPPGGAPRFRQYRRACPGLEIDTGARADRSLVPAGPTWKRIRYLVQHEGFTKAEIARRLGLERPAIQFGKRRITAATAARVERFYRLQIGE